MQLRMWTYDIAREQSPSLDYLRKLCRLSLNAGYTAMGLYLEHRFAYPSTPWSHGVGCVTPAMVRTLQSEYPTLDLIPCINLLGHCEGMIYTEYGSQFAEERFKGLQADPSNPAFVELAERIVDDVLSIFTSKIIHIGGDETAQLGAGQASQARVAAYEARGATDGKAALYGDHFGPLAKRVVDAGRIPAVWGDMFFDHPDALDKMPKETIIFDWQYFRSPEYTSARFFAAGHPVVFCPAIHTYNATWCHLPQSEQNVRQHAEAAERNGALGVCVTTWECGLFGNYETILPAVQACGTILNEAQPGTPPVYEKDWNPKGQGGSEAIAKCNEATDAPIFLDAYAHAFGDPSSDSSRAAAEWARLMGVELQTAGGQFAFGGIRSALKCRLLLYSNPFLMWLHHREELCGEVGERAIRIAEHASSVAPNPNMRGISEFLRKGVEFVRFAELAHQAYAAGKPGEALVALSPCRQIFEDLEKVAIATSLNACGSLADVERCKRAKEHVELVIRRVKQYGDGVLGYLPSFEQLTHPKFMPHDQAAWWLINKWANE